MKILIELPSWLGDTLMATPAIENIISHFDDAQITFIGSKVSIETLKLHPQVNLTKIINKNYFEFYRTAKKLGYFDVFLSFRNSFRSNIYKLFIKSQIKYQFDKKKYINRHQVEKYNDFINDSLNLNAPAGPLFLYPKRLHSNNKKILGINPGASYGSAKRWYPQEFAKVALALSSEFDIHLFGGPNEKDIAGEIEQLFNSSGLKNFKNYAGKTSVNQLIELISQVDLFITGDSGPMHVAASFNIPTVAIFGPTNDIETSQWKNEKNINIKKNLSCQPCMSRTCPLGHHNCMRLIKSTDVLEAINLIEA